VLVKCGIAECGMRKVKCGIQNCGNGCGTVGKRRNAERVYGESKPTQYTANMWESRAGMNRPTECKMAICVLFTVKKSWKFESNAAIDVKKVFTFFIL